MADTGSGTVLVTRSATHQRTIFDPGEWPIKTPAHSPLPLAIQQAAATVFGKPPVVSGLSAEGTILRHVAMPLVLTGFSNADCNLHAPNEKIRVADYIRGIKYAAAIMHEFATIE